MTPAVLKLDHLIVGLLVAACLGGVGCRTTAPGHAAPMPGEVTGIPPRELDKAILPPYRIEPPDILMIDAVQVVPKAPYQLKVLDVLAIRVQGTLPDEPIDGLYPVGPDGTVDLGFSNGRVRVVGMTVEQVEQAIEAHLRQSLTEPKVDVSLAQLAAQQQIVGEHLVAPDGTVTLGTYGSVLVVGRTIAEAKHAIEQHLSQYLADPEVSVDVFAYNSKVYYVITQGAGLGDGVYRFPITGNETVLDAISQINGLEQVSSKQIWVARAGRDCYGCDRILPVNWNAITQCGRVETNYQVLPGDRVYIAEDRLIALDTGIGKLTAPFERVMGFTLLGVGTATRLS
jgi:polysaccharide export outer membrane protein